MIEWSNFYLPEGISPVMEQMTEFHDHAMMILFMILSFLTTVFMKTMVSKNYNYELTSSEMMEMIWTSFPIIVLLILAIPSIQVLFMMEELITPSLTIKIVGSQWFWSYEQSDFVNFKLDSFMSKDMGIFRYMETDVPLILPFLTHVRLLITSSDVIHSWTVPSLGIKMDASPGRLNASPLFSFRSGYFYGQCSEICGVNHSFMPIKLVFVSQLKFKTQFYS
uniref:Cytochrome c oxidase subunit 2 n=1 Tax=Liposcelis nr. bostrychophila AZ TaxID=1643344 RepID=A0A0F6TMQ6_9NEOP|nr:cytochrome c oxidase subunit II [Liposcelis nr. bostrychophila AZ]